MSDFDFRFSPRHGRRMQRKLRALERLTSVMSLKLDTPQAESKTLLRQELSDKGLADLADAQSDNVRGIKRSN